MLYKAVCSIYGDFCLIFVGLLPLLLSIVIVSEEDGLYSIDFDQEGYIAYCPCMGRFGNQADHFLGALAFAKALNRTFLIPPWVEYKYGKPKSIQKPYKTYFEPSYIAEYHKSMPMEDFMENLAEKIWPVEKRVSFCHSPRIFSETDKPNDCNAKDGNPFGPFWDTFDINFTKSEFWNGLSLSPQTSRQAAKKWRKKFPASLYPVLAFTGAPAAFPVREGDRQQQKYVKWNKKMIDKRDSFIREHLGDGDYVSVHLRNGIDWVRACEHVESSRQMFAVAQCLGYENEWGLPTRDLCYPPPDTIIQQVRGALTQTGAHYLYVASDSDRMTTRFMEEFPDVKVVWQESPPAGPHDDLAMLAASKHFIGNCLSSFTAFVKRERDVSINNLTSSFFSFPLTSTPQTHGRGEL